MSAALTIEIVGGEDGQGLSGPPPAETPKAASGEPKSPEAVRGDGVSRPSTAKEADNRRHQTEQNQAQTAVAKVQMEAANMLSGAVSSLVQSLGLGALARPAQQLVEGAIGRRSTSSPQSVAPAQRSDSQVPAVTKESAKPTPVDRVRTEGSGQAAVDRPSAQPGQAPPVERVQTERSTFSPPETVKSDRSRPTSVGSAGRQQTAVQRSSLLDRVPELPQRQAQSVQQPAVRRAAPGQIPSVQTAPRSAATPPPLPKTPPPLPKTTPPPLPATVARGAAGSAARGASVAGGASGGIAGLGSLATIGGPAAIAAIVSAAGAKIGNDGAGPAGAVVGSFSISLAAAAKAVRSFGEVVGREAEKHRNFSPDIAAAATQSDLRMHFARFEGAQRIGPTLAPFERARGRGEAAIERSITEFKTQMLRLLRPLLPIVERGIDGIEIVTSAVATTGDRIAAIHALMTGNWEEALELWKSGNKNRKQLVEYFLGKDKEDLEQDMLKELLSIFDFENEDGRVGKAAARFPVPVANAGP